MNVVKIKISDLVPDSKNTRIHSRKNIEAVKAKLTVPVIPNSKIDEYGAGMYLGEKITQLARHISR